LFDYSIEDSEVKQAFIARAAQVVVLCDSSKFDHRSLARVCDFSEVDMLVTDAEPPAHLTQVLSAAKIGVLVAAQTMRQG
jgi:DeoR family glycerol-3-phosphate regulon repressor